MAQSIEETLREILGEPFDRLTQFQSEQMNKLVSRVQDIAREAMKPELAKLQSEITELRSRLVILEGERIAAAAESIDPAM